MNEDQLNPYFKNIDLGWGNQNSNMGMPQTGIPPVTEGFDWQKMFMGGEDPLGNESMGALTGGISAIGGLGNLALGYKQYGLAKDQLGFQREQANINNQNQMTTLNNLMRAQADSRKLMGNNPNTALTGEEYVSQHGIRV